MLAGRWSPRSFDPSHSVTDDDVLRLIEAARWSPSARNMQPWFFVVGRRGDSIHQRLVPFVQGRSDWALDASLWVVNCYDTFEREIDLALYDLGAAVHQMIMQAEDMGLHVRQFATFDRAGFTKEFQLPATRIAVTMSAIGVTPPGIGPGERDREELPCICERVLSDN